MNPEEATRERLNRLVDGMDRRTRAAREARLIVDEAATIVRTLTDEAARNVAAAEARAQEAEVARKRAVEAADGLSGALEIRRGGQERPGEDVQFLPPKGANGRDWTIDEIEDVMFRLRVAGCPGDTRVRVRAMQALESRIPTDAELVASKRDQEQVDRLRAEAVVKRKRKRVRTGVVLAVATPVLLPVVFLLLTVIRWALGATWNLLVG